MNLIPYIFGLIGSIATAIVVVLFNQWTGWEIHSLSILFIIPIGGILLGMGGAGGFFLGRRLTNTKMLKIDYIIAIALGLLTFFGVNYIAYINTYISVDSNDEIKILNQFSQPTDYTSISQFISFGDYMNMINSSSTHQFRYKGAVKVGDEFEVGETTTTILFYIQLLGVILGSLAMALFLADSKYCDKCKKYYKNKVLKSFDLEKFDEYVEIINKNIKNGISLKKAINELKGYNSKDKKYGQIELLYCPSCHDSYLLIKFFAIDSNNESKEITDLQQTISLEQGVSIELSK